MVIVTLKDDIKLADSAPECTDAVRAAQRTLVEFEVECQKRRDDETKQHAILMGAHGRAEAKMRNALLAGQRILSLVPLAIRQDADRAAQLVRAHNSDVERALRDHKAAQAMLDKRQEDASSPLGKQEHAALLEQLSRAKVALDAQVNRHDELEDAQKRAETLVAAEVAKIRKSAK